MRSKKRRIRFVLTMVLAAGTFVPGFAASAQESFTRFLLPFYLTNFNPTPGAYGSRWGVETWLHYAGSKDAFMVPRPLCPGITCMSGWFLEPGRAPLPLHVQLLSLEPAIFIHVDSRYAPFVKFSSRIRDLSRMTESAGTSIPVIREDQFSAGPLVLLNVPLDPAFRNMLRIYALPEVTSPEVEVRYFRHPDADAPDLDVVLLRSERVSLRTTPGVIGGVAGVDFHLYPSMAERGNLQDLVEFAGHEAVWIEIAPVTPGLRFWAFVSVTNNTTQEVTIITP